MVIVTYFHFHLDSYPTVLFYYKGQDGLKPTIVKEKIQIFPLRDYVDDMLDGNLEFWLLSIEYYGGEL